MAYNFSRTSDYAIIEDSSNGAILTTRESLPVFAQEGIIYIPTKAQTFHCQFSEIGTIDGQTAANIGAAVLLLGKTFKGFPGVNVIIEG